MPVYSNLLTALGWSLLDNIWQMAACWMAYGMLTFGNKRFSATAKHNLALMSVMTGSAWFIYSFFHLVNEPADHLISGFIPVSEAADQWIPYGTMVYLAILTVRGFQYGIQHYRHQKSVAGRSVSGALQSFADRNAQLLGISKRISVYLSAHTETALTSGFHKPLILLPVSLLTRLSPVQLEAILVHELFHIRRNDYLINIFMTCYRGIFFFNPFAHLFYKVIAAERELACDDGVIQMNYQPAIYAEALYSLERFRQVHPHFAIAADGNKPWLLMDRIRRVLGKPVVKKNHIRPVVIFNMVIALALFGMQVKTFRQASAVSLPVASLAAAPAGYIIEKDGIGMLNREITKPVANHKHTIKKPVAPLMLIIVNDTISAIEPAALEQSYFVNDNTVRNFSNESSAGPGKALMQIVPGTPYLPSGSLAYQRMLAVLPDSIPEKLAENNIREMIAESHLEIASTLKEAEAEVKVQEHYLKEMVIKNRRLLLLNKKSIHPVLEKIRHEIGTRKKQIDQLQIQLQVSDEEIIHI
jgi:beta-lactamase regulating signal transducer with metallopeptidase domain